jgi:hypothetical protein
MHTYKHTCIHIYIISYTHTYVRSYAHTHKHIHAHELKIGIQKSPGIDQIPAELMKAECQTVTFRDLKIIHYL